MLKLIKKFLTVGVMKDEKIDCKADNQLYAIYLLDNSACLCYIDITEKG